MSSVFRRGSGGTEPTSTNSDVLCIPPAWTNAPKGYAAWVTGLARAGERQALMRLGASEPEPAVRVH